MKSSTAFIICPRVIFRSFQHRLAQRNHLPQGQMSTETWNNMAGRRNREESISGLVIDRNAIVASVGRVYRCGMWFH
jgi:hypothetical protein